MRIASSNVRFNVQVLCDILLVMESLVGVSEWAGRGGADGNGGQHQSSI